MRVKSSISGMVLMMAGLLFLSGLIYGCYSREAVPEKKNIYGQDIKPNPLSQEELRKFSGSIRKLDGEAEAHYQLALHFQEKCRHKLAIDELKQVLQRNPVHFRAYNALGVSFDNLGDHEAAIDHYKLALQIDPKLDYVYNNLGYSYLLKGDPQKAAEAFQQAIALNEKEKRYRNNLGLVYVKQDKFELAFEQFSALDSEANAEKTLAKVMKDLGKGAATENVLLAVKSVHRKEDVAKPVTPTSKLPELSAKTPETTPGQDPVAHFRSVKNGINTLRDLEIYSDAQDPAISDQSDAAARASADDQDELVAEVKEEHEERILVAAFSVKAGGWQNAPEPKRTAEMGIVEVEVTNGNGVKGSAGKVAEHLRRNGFKVVRVLDAQSHDHFSTKVFYGGNLKEAQRLLKAIPEIASGAELYELESMGGHIRLLIGKDLIERNKILSWVNPNAKS